MKSELSWIELDQAELTEETIAMLAEYKAAYKLMKEARKTFEDNAALDMGTPSGKCWKFGYMFGKVSVALAPKAEERVKSSKPKQSLAEYLAQQA